jgi:hypothetical protein
MGTAMRADYCPIGGEPCQSLCTEPCSAGKSVNAAGVNELMRALKIISIWAENGRTEKDFDDIAKLASETIKHGGMLL